MRRVAVTGLGAVTPLGLDAPSTWRAARRRRERRRLHPGLRRERLPGADRGRGEGLRPQPRSPRRRRRGSSTATSCSRSARRRRRGGRGRRRPRPGARRDPRRLGDRRPARHRRAARRAARARARPRLAVLHPDRARRLGERPDRDLARARGPNYAPVSACATGSHAVGEAAELIKRGDADVVLAGGTESCIHPLILAGFCAMRGLVAEDEDPTRASRPFDATRAGFVMGEGACILVLEELEAAQARGATIYAEVLGYGASNDAHHMAQPEPEAIGVAEMMRAALDAGGRRARAGRLRQRARHVDAARRRGRDARDQAGLRRPRLPRSPSPRRSRSPATASGRPARSRR